MIKGAKFWNDKERTYLIQTDNPTDSLLRKVLKKFDPYYLETCGPTAACICLAALGYDLKILTSGGYIPQPEEILQDWCNDPNTKQIRERIRKGVDYLPGNRIPQFYPEAARQVFGKQIKSQFSWSGNNFTYVQNYLESKCAIQLCLKKPGHYIAALAFDEDTQEIIYNDPWPNRRGLKYKGFNERMEIEEFKKNVQSYCIVYFLKNE